MIGWTSQRDFDQLVATPPEPPELPFFDGVAAVIESGRLTDQSISTNYQLGDSLRRSLAAYAEAGGPEYELPWMVSDSVAKPALAWLNSQRDRIMALRGDPASQLYPDLKTGDEINAEVVERVEQARAKAARAGLGAQVAGGVGVGLSDPLVLATLPFGASAAQGLFARMGIEAAVAGASQVAVEAASLEAKERAGVTPTVAEAAGNVALTALGGAGLAGLLHGAGAAARKAGLLREYRAKVAAGEVTPTGATEAAADALQDHLDTIPALATPEAEAAHLRATEAAVDVLRAETPEAEAAAMARLEARAAEVPEGSAPAAEVATDDVPGLEIHAAARGRAAAAEAAVLAERANPTPPVAETPLDAPPALDALDEETAAAFRGVIEAEPDAPGVYAADDGQLRTGRTADLAEEIDGQRSAVQAIRDCLLGAEVTP